MANGGLGHCPNCGDQLGSVIVKDVRFVRCTKKTCPFNYVDLTCPTCGGAVTHAKVRGFNEYTLTCAKAHVWDHADAV